MLIKKNIFHQFSSHAGVKADAPAPAPYDLRDTRLQPEVCLRRQGVALPGDGALLGQGPHPSGQAEGTRDTGGRRHGEDFNHRQDGVS